MVKTLNSGGFCTCNSPTIAKDNSGVRYCQRCSKDMEENLDQGVYAFSKKDDSLDDKIHKDNLASLSEATLDKDATSVTPDVDCPFCYGKTGWSYSTGAEGDKEDEAYCGDCDIVYKIETGAYISGSGDPKTIQAKHNKPAKNGGAEDKSVKIIKNGETPIDDKKDDVFEKHYCIADKSSDRFQIKCEYCPFVCATWADALPHETVDSSGRKKGHISGGGGFVSYTSCSHEPGHAIAGGEQGWDIYVGSKWGCSGKLKNYDLVINLTGDSVFRTGHVIPIPSLSKFATKKESLKPIEVILDWPDMGVVDLGRDWWDALAAYIRKSKSKVVMFCMGGHGRTGTALATLLVVMLKWTAAESIKWVRENHCKKAIETVSQMQYIYVMAGEKPPSDLKARKGKGSGGNMQIATVGGNDDKGGYQASLEKGGTTSLL